MSKFINEKSIREAAFYRWLARGAPQSNNPDIDWFGAKEELERKQNRKNALKFFPINSIFGLNRRMNELEFSIEHKEWIIDNIAKYNLDFYFSEYYVNVDTIIVAVCKNNTTCSVAFSPIVKDCSYCNGKEQIKIIKLDCKNGWEELQQIISDC